jgi:hypothetical protein
MRVVAWLDAFRGGPVGAGVDASPGAADFATQGPGRVLACAKCQSPVTHKSALIAVDGSRTHVFTNPDGDRFRIGCFAEARGLIGVGRPTLEYTWFAGFTWQVELCARCQDQLGWLYRSGVSGFHGLILAQLLELDEARH